MRSILITGGCGFVGSNIAVHLAASFVGVRIVCMDNLYRKGSDLNVSRLQTLGIPFHHGDVRTPASFPREAFDVLIECSAEPSVLAGQDGSPDYLFTTNVVGLYHCLEYCRRNGSHMIFLSTSRVYPVAPLEAHGFREEETRFVWTDEGMPAISSQGVSEALSLSGARSLYGFSKLAGEQLIEEYRASFGLGAVINRCGVIAGPWQFGKIDQGVIAFWIMAHMFGRPLSYIGYGGIGKQVRDVLHVDDLCCLIEMQVRDFPSWEGWLGNVTGGLSNSVSLRELTALCRRITGKVVPVASQAATRPFDLRLFIGNCERLFSRTSWRPQLDVTSTIEQTASWVFNNRVALERHLH
jgi:CDP-paratose 2-epimerase